MAEFRGYRERSRTNWGSSEEALTLEQINAGALMRIADASEAMAKNHVALMREREMYERMYRERQATCQRLSRQVSALRGVITKLKRGAR